MNENDKQILQDLEKISNEVKNYKIIKKVVLDGGEKNGVLTMDFMSTGKTTCTDSQGNKAQYSHEAAEKAIAKAQQTKLFTITEDIY